MNHNEMFDADDFSTALVRANDVAPTAPKLTALEVVDSQTLRYYVMDESSSMSCRMLDTYNRNLWNNLPAVCAARWGNARFVAALRRLLGRIATIGFHQASDLDVIFNSPYLKSEYGDALAGVLHEVAGGRTFGTVEFDEEDLDLEEEPEEDFDIDDFVPQDERNYKTAPVMTLKEAAEYVGFQVRLQETRYDVMRRAALEATSKRFAKFPDKAVTFCYFADLPSTSFESIGSQAEAFNRLGKRQMIGGGTALTETLELLLRRDTNTDEIRHVTLCTDGTEPIYNPKSLAARFVERRTVCDIIHITSSGADADTLKEFATITGGTYRTTTTAAELRKELFLSGTRLALPPASPQLTA